MRRQSRRNSNLDRADIPVVAKSRSPRENSQGRINFVWAEPVLSAIQLLLIAIILAAAGAPFYSATPGLISSSAGRTDFE